MKTSKVKSVTVSGNWDKDGTTYHNHNYEMEDGQKIQASHKTMNPFNVGDEVEYEVKRTHATYGDQGSVKKPNNFNRGGGFKRDTVGVAIGNALNNATLLVANGKVAIGDLEVYARRITEVAFKLKEEFKNK